MEIQKDKERQELNLVLRKHLDISGVCEVVRFDDLCVVLMTACGELTVDGADIKISVLDTDRGVVSLDGRIDAMYYSAEKGEEKRGFFGRLFS